jgi:hypothetical protein
MERRRTKKAYSFDGRGLLVETVERRRVKFRRGDV